MTRRSHNARDNGLGNGSTAESPGTKEEQPAPSPEIRVTLLLGEVDLATGRALAIVGPPRSQRNIGLTFPPALAEDFARLAGSRALVQGTADKLDGEPVTSIRVKEIEQGPQSISSTELFLSTNDWPLAPDEPRVVEGVSFDFDVDEFLESIYEGRGRTWAKSNSS